MGAMPPLGFVAPRAAWGAGPLPESVPHVAWPPGVTCWIHHSAGITAAVVGPGMPGPRWLGMLAHRARHPARTIARVQARVAVARAARSQTVAHEIAGMKALDRLHRRNGWIGGVGYGWVVWPSSRAYEGRGLWRRGTHRPGANGEPSICFALDGTKYHPTQGAVATALRIAEAIGAGRLRGHGDGYPTACPGPHITAALGLPRTLTKGPRK